MSTIFAGYAAAHCAHCPAGPGPLCVVCPHNALNARLRRIRLRVMRERELRDLERVQFNRGL